jgi:hypothetical protein
MKQCCETGTGTAGSVTFCPSRTAIGTHYGSASGSDPELDLDPDPTQNVIKT